MKNKEPIDFEMLPESVVDIIAWYAVALSREALLRAPTRALFPGNGAGPKSRPGAAPPDQQGGSSTTPA